MSMQPQEQVKVIVISFLATAVLTGILTVTSVLTAKHTKEHMAAHPSKHAQAAEHGANTAHDKAPEHAAPDTGHEKPAEKMAAKPSGDKEAGAKVFASKTCTTCHTVSKIPGANGAVGPKLDGLGERAASRVSGLDAETYIKQSIEKPAAFVVTGFPPAMPELRPTMSDKEFNDLVAFLASL